MDVMGMEATGRAARIARSDDKENWKLYKNMLRYANICYTQYSNFDYALQISVRLLHGRYTIYSIYNR